MGNLGGGEQPVNSHLFFYCTCQTEGFFKSQLCLRFWSIWERGWLGLGRGPQPTGQREWGGWGSHACACFLCGCLEGIAAQPLRYCRLTAHYLHHQNAATPNKEGKTKQNRKNKQHVRVRGILLDFHDYCFQIQVSFYLIQNWVISIAYFKKCLL